MRSTASLLGGLGLAIAGALLFLPPLLAAPEKSAAKKPESLTPAVRIPLGPQAWGVPDAFQMGMPDKIGFGAYDGRTRTARYRLEILTAESVRGSAKRRDNFHADRAWPLEYRAQLEDYAAVSLDYDRGHLHPAGDSPTLQEKMDATFALSNMTPQHKLLNRGLWKQLEEMLRDAATRGDVAAVWVITVPLYAPEDLPEQGEATEARVSFAVAGPNHVPIPTHYAKAALFLGKRSDNPVAVRAWVFANRPPRKRDSIDGARCSVDLIEHYSGLDFFAELPDALERKLEAAK
jgi:DNA/RNA endonuclease G (NUC1)